MTPEPLTPAECDLRDFQFMPFDVVRFAQSDLIALEEPEAVVAAILLWGASWHGRPAGSLTDDDRSLSQAAGYGRAVTEWLKVKDGALRGWIRCSDGRLYHPVVAEKVQDAWDGKLRQRHRTYLAAIRKHNERDKEKGGLDQRTAPTFDEWIASDRPSSVVTRDKGGVSRVTSHQVTQTGGEHSQPVTPPEPQCHAKNSSKGQGQGEGQGIKKEGTSSLFGQPAAPTDPRPSTALVPVDGARPTRARKLKAEPTAVEQQLFDQFWAAYPKKVAKPEALAAYLAIIRTGRPEDSPEAILAGAEVYAAVRAGQDPHGTKHPQGWLNGRRWEDDHSDFHRGTHDDEHRPANDFGTAPSYVRRSRAERDQQAALAVLAERRAAIR